MTDNPEPIDLDVVEHFLLESEKAEDTARGLRSTMCRCMLAELRRHRAAWMEIAAANKACGDAAAKFFNDGDEDEVWRHEKHFIRTCRQKLAELGGAEEGRAR